MKILIKELRLKLNMTQSMFSEKAGISIRYLQNLEAGDNTPTLEMLYQIAKAFNVSIHELIDD
jgi:transcriptional regulator with XRE-family HTH domain